MRDIFVTLLFTIAAFAALKRPYYGALLWVWIGLMNPHRLGWGFAYTLPFGVLAAAVTVMGMMFAPKDVRWLKGGPVIVLMIFIVWMGLTSATAIHVDYSFSKYVEVLKVLGMVIVVGTLVRTREEIMGLIATVVFSIGFFGFKGGIFTVMTGGAHRVWGPPSSLVNGNNELAVALVMIIPLLYFLVQQIDLLRSATFFGRVPRVWLKRGLYAVIGFSAVAAIGSQSRGAFLAIGAMGAVLWWRSQSKLPLTVVMLLMIPAILLLMPEEWYERMGTIQTYDEDASAQGRLIAWKMAIDIANDRFMGAGFAAATKYVYSLYAPGATSILVAHSIYFEVLGHHGYFGLFLYLLFWWLTYRTAGRLARIGKTHEELTWVAQFGSMAKVSLVGFAVGGAFLSLAYWDMPFYVMVALVATEQYAKGVLRTQAQAKEHVAVTGTAPGQERIA